MKPSVYVETSVVSYLVSRPSSDAVVAGHQQSTKTWWKTAGDRFDLFASEAVLLEASRGDPDAAAERLDALREMTLLDIGREEEELAKELIAGRAVPESAAEDALHIAIAAAQGIEFLVT